MTPAQILVAVLLAMVIAFGGAWQVQDWRYGKQLADIGEAQAIAITNAVSVARIEEQRRQATVNEEARNAREQNKTAALDAGIADVAGDRLHLEANNLASSACPGDPGAAQRGASATRAAMVLSDLLQRADKRAGELAAAYDRARIAGLSCERIYDSLK